jgi:hypothetical protein
MHAEQWAIMCKLALTEDGLVIADLQSGIGAYATSVQNSIQNGECHREYRMQACLFVRGRREK